MAWPTTDDPRTEFVTVRFTVLEKTDLDWLVTATGAKNASEAIRSGMDRVIAAERKRAKSRGRSGTGHPSEGTSPMDGA